jgi:hypothetical protein
MRVTYVAEHLAGYIQLLFFTFDVCGLGDNMLFMFLRDGCAGCER